MEYNYFAKRFLACELYDLSNYLFIIIQLSSGEFVQRIFFPKNVALPPGTVTRNAFSQSSRHRTICQCEILNIISNSPC